MWTSDGMGNLTGYAGFSGARFGSVCRWLRTGALSFVVTACAASAQSVKPSSVVAPVCGPLTWGTQQLLSTREGQWAYSEAAQGIATPNGITLLGWPALAWSTHDRFAPANPKTRADSAAILRNLRVIGFSLDSQRRAESIAPPPGVKRMVWPRAVTGADGVADLVWGTPADTDSTPDGVITTMWHARFRSGIWSVPTKVLSADRLQWGLSSRSTLVSVGGQLHAVVPFYDHPGSRGIAYARLIGGQWRTTKSPVSGLPQHPSVVVVAPDTIVVTYSATDLSSKERNGSHVFAIRTAIRDTAWPRARMVHWSGTDGVVWPEVFQLGRIEPTLQSSRALAVVWGDVGESSRGVRRLRLALSLDGGLSWSARDSLPTPNGIVALSAHSDGRGSVHVVYQEASSAGPSGGDGPLSYTRWASGSWQPAQLLPFDISRSAPQLSRLRADTILLTWGVGRPAQPGPGAPIAPVTAFALAPPGCPPRR